MLPVGTKVQWQQKKVTGEKSRLMTAVVVGAERVVRSDQTAVDCAILSINRLVPFQELRPVGEVMQVVAPVFTDDDDPWCVIGCDDADSADVSPEVVQESVPVAVQCRVPEESDPCSVMVVDYMNLLVRSWHVGRPSEVHAVRGMWQTLANAIRAVRPDRVVFALDGGHVERTRLLPEYKAHRPSADPDLVRQRELGERALQIAGFQAVRVDGWEADDVVASIASRVSGVVICSSDKDLLALCDRSRVYQPWSGGQFCDSHLKLGVAANEVLDFLALCGDKADGVPGCPGVGPVNALKLLGQYGSLDAIGAARESIPGAVGQRLRDHWDQLVLSREVVRLNDALELPELCGWSPRPGWQQRLTELRLGSVAAIVDGLVSGGFLREGVVAASSPDVLVRRSADLPIRDTAGFSPQQIYGGEDRGAVWNWERGRDAAARGAECSSGWKAGHYLDLAWLQGFRGEDLAVSVSGTAANPPEESRVDQQLELF